MQRANIGEFADSGFDYLKTTNICRRSRRFPISGALSSSGAESMACMDALTHFADPMRRIAQCQASGDYALLTWNGRRQKKTDALEKLLLYITAHLLQSRLFQP